MDKQTDGVPRFYRGDLDDQVVTAANGAEVNRTYADFVATGPWAEVKTWQVTPRIHTITGYGLANHTFVEGETGLIMIDTGQNIGAGHEALRMKEAFSSKPVVAVVYSHHHYTRGTRAVIQAHPGREVAIYGHPDVDQNMQDLFSYLSPGRFRRGFVQFGRQLPEEGPDAEYSVREPEFSDPALNAGGHVPITHPVADGERLQIDGLEVVFYHTTSDTEDSLIVHFPELDAVVHNTAVMPFLFPMYTLRGDYYRSPPEVLASIDQLRALNAEHLIGCHGVPVSGKADVAAFATAHRDALAYVYQQTVRGINRGYNPDQIAQEVVLPQQLTALPELYPAYVDVEHMVRGIYRGLVGWFAEELVDLHPPSSSELAEEIIAGFGGAEALLTRVSDLLQEKRYNLAAQLAGYVLADDPGHQHARQLRATALRNMARATPTGMQTRNFLLHGALTLEGKIPAQPDHMIGRIPLPAAAVAAMPPAAAVEVLMYTIDGRRAAALNLTVRIEITDAAQAFTLNIRHGATEVTEPASPGYDLLITLDRLALAEALVGGHSLTDLVEAQRAEFTGDTDLQTQFLAAYHEVL